LRLLPARLLVLTLALGAVVALFGAARSAKEARDKPEALYEALRLIRPEKPLTAKAFTLPAPGGGAVRLEDFQGQVIFLNFWATWCLPCREEMPAMERLYRKLKAKGFVVLAVSIDAEGSEAAVVAFLREHGLTYPVALDPTMEVARLYTVRALPSTYLIDRKGRIAAMALGAREWDGPEAVALMEALLAQPS